MNLDFIVTFRVTQVKANCLNVLMFNITGLFCLFMKSCSFEIIVRTTAAFTAIRQKSEKKKNKKTQKIR